MQNPLTMQMADRQLPDFQAIRPEHVLPAIEDLLKNYHRGIEAWLQSGSSADWSLVESEVAWADALNRAWSPVSHLNSVADNEHLRKVYNAGLERLTEHESWRQQHAGIFQAYRQLRQSEKYSALSPVQQRIIELELRDFHLAGVDLSDKDQEAYRNLVMRLSKLGSKFSENLIDATQAWTLHVEDSTRLAGLPVAELNLLEGIAKNHGQSGWMIDLSAPSFQAVMTHADDARLRCEVYTAYVTRASDEGPSAGQWDNMPLIVEMLSLRHQLAQLLGFDNYVEYALARRMAESPRMVLEFLEQLAKQARPPARKQFSTLQEFAESRGAAIPLEAWDIAYWSERYRQAELHLSDEELKPYFSLDPMLEALFFTAGELFGLTLEPDTRVPAWHPDVRFYWVLDCDGKRFAGLYMDLYSRKNKRGGAWMDVCCSRRILESGVQLPVAYLTCNFAPPTGQQPCLMTHDDVQTLFHEFGHCLHHLLTEVDWPQVNGINGVEWDAVELPSQLLENWCWEEEILSRFARHYQDDTQMPGDLKDRLLRSREFQKALFLVRQLEYAICDIRLHLEYNPNEPENPLDLLAQVRSEVSVVPVPSWNRFLNSFGHIFGGGYAAGYYSYLWAEQLAADAWGRFREEGPLGTGPGEALRREILSVGSSRPAMDSFIAFRGRPPEPRPLLQSYGLSGEPCTRLDQRRAQS
ncbi:MAG: M3 family metallopeptidase [Xanthomonadales bacterium]|nr:M3 family metallopeptidase [Gammaproteobacteria bacterium]MBT8052489.1 M3 family metallopeptidase [Gammaproteobacteria bacterium]NND57137.1 M3 family metallopeptidase [Xanthomonadales bacterium]NNK52787.1 M3 family metallopeptidase [Xanthomonadales bacterium]